MTLAQQIQSILESTEYDNIGLRADLSSYRVGETLPASRSWLDLGAIDDQYISDDLVFGHDGLVDCGELSGTCAVEIRRWGTMKDVDLALALIKNYLRDGASIYVIGSNDAQVGNDPGEIIISDAVCVALL